MPPEFGYKIDQRDGHSYRTVLMPDGNWWFAEDYKYDPENNAQTQWSVLYSAYRIPSAPPGCHTPSEDEWRVLQASLSPADSAGILLRSATDWTTSVQSSDPYGFNAKPSGVWSNGGIVYSGIYAGWWLGSGYNKLVVAANEQAALFWFYSDTIGNAHAMRFIVDSGNIPDSHPICQINIGVEGAWKPGELFVGDGGVWKPGVIKVGDSGVWK